MRVCRTLLSDDRDGADTAQSSQRVEPLFRPKPLKSKGLGIDDGRNFAGTPAREGTLGHERTKGADADPRPVSSDGTRIKVQITRKLAEFIDGVDLSARRVGDVIDVPVADAKLLLAEEWAVHASDSEPRRVEAVSPPRPDAEFDCR